MCEDRPSGTYDNVRRSRAKGVELGMMLKPVEALNLSANYTWMDAESRDTGLDLARRPKHSINASEAYRWPFGLETGAPFVNVGSRFDDASNTRKLGGYEIGRAASRKRVCTSV